MTRRTYGQYCALARALDVVGERWTLLIIRDLLIGPRRFTDLAKGLRGIGTSILADRLRNLEAEGIIERSYLPPPAASRVYELTADGRDLADALMPLVAWGARRLGPLHPDEAFNPQWLLLALEHHAFDPRRAEGVTATVDFELDGHVFHVGVRDGHLTTGVGPAPDGADVTLRSDVETFVGVLLGRIAPDDALASGAASVDGDAGALVGLLSTMRAPAPTG